METVVKEDFFTESTRLLQKNFKRKRREATRCRKAVVLICCIVMHIVAYGIGYGLSVMYAELIVVFDVLRATAALIPSLNMGLGTSAGILFIGFIRKLGPGMSMVLSGIVACAALVASAFATTLTVIILCTGVLSGLALSVCVLASFIVTGLMFRENASIYLILLTTGFAIGQITYPLLFDMFISQYTWSGAFLLIAAVSLNCVPCGLIIHYSQRYYDPEGSIKHMTSASICDRTILRDPVLWIVMLNSLFLFATVSMESWFLVDIMVSRGFPRDYGSILVSSLGIGSFFGRFLGGIVRYVSKFPTGYHWIYLFLLTGGFHALIINMTEFKILLPVCFIYGITFATSGSQLPAITFEASGVDRYVQAMAFVNLFSGVGDTVGPLFGGYIKDTFGKYDLAFYTGTGINICMSFSTVAMVCIQRHRKLRAGTEIAETEEVECLIKK